MCYGWPERGSCQPSHSLGVFESEDRADAEFADPCPVQQDPVPKLETPKASSSEPVRSPSTVSDASQENTQAVKGGKSAPPGSATDNHGFTQATAVFKENFPKLPDNALSVPQDTLRRIFAQLSELRHTPVHRLPITAGDTSRIITSALSLAEALQDTARSAVLAELISEVEEEARALGQNIVALEARITLELEDVDRARRELDAEERRILAQQTVEDWECRNVIRSVLMDSERKVLADD
ncbi:Pre-mRNA-splicing factor 18 [Verticillium dahliae VDG2]|nr:Pre-mRNA-splicing factor 18 [Verticillium dahliae VDG2]